MIRVIASLWTELKQRLIYRVAAAYTLGGLAVLSAAELILEPLGFDAARTFVTLLVLLGFPFALVLTSAHGVRRRLLPRDGTAVTAGVLARGAAPSETPVEQARKSIIVLPFDNISSDSGDGYFSDGLTEEIIAHLSHLQSLRVISRSSAMTLKGSRKDVRTIGHELGVQYVLEGSVRKVGSDLRITAQLSDAQRDEHLWAETYDGTLDDVFDVQEQVSRSIARALDLTLDPREQEKLLERPIDNVQAYECYLRARKQAFKGTRESLEEAFHHLEMGLEILGENELLYHGLAEAHLNAYEYGIKPDDETLRKAEEFVAKVTQLVPASANSHYLKGRIERFRGSASRAAVHFEAAVGVDPNHVGGLLFLLGVRTLQIGRPSSVEAVARHLERIDPLSPLTLLNLGWHHWLSGRPSEAIEMLERTWKVEPSFLWAPIFRVYVHLWEEQYAEAASVLDRVAQDDPTEMHSDWVRLLRCTLSGDREGARAAVSEDVRAYCWRDPELPWFLSSAYSLAGAKDEALAWFEHTIDHGWINYPLFSEQDPLLDNIRREKRFEAILATVKTRWEAFGNPRAGMSSLHVAGDRAHEPLTAREGTT